MGHGAAVGELTGRSENVEDTHRSSIHEQRHQEFHSVGPVSRDHRQQELDEDYKDDFDAMRAASNE